MSYILHADLKKEFDRRMETLYEDGIFSSGQRSISDGSRYLFIGYGGAGTAALYQLRAELKKALPENQLKSHVRFLSVDSDRHSQEYKEAVTEDMQTRLVTRDSLSEEEFFWLDTYAAKGQIQTNPQQFASWLNKDLQNQIQPTQNQLLANSATGIRQIGRLLMLTPENANGLRRRVKKLAIDLRTNNADTLHVVILTGVSGSTGSGIVIDATYLIRDALSDLPFDRHTQYLGFVLLPPALGQCHGYQVAPGNCNGYAAMKEINHYMNLSDGADPESAYVQQLGEKLVCSRSSLFDACYLLDDGPRGFLGPLTVPNSVLAKILLDMITTRQTIDSQILPMDFLTFDGAVRKMQLIHMHSPQAAPRDVDYNFGMLTHSSVYFALDEIKILLTKIIFDKLYSLYKMNADATEKEVKDFVRQLCRSKNWRSLAGDQVKQFFVDEEYGPFFVVKLLYEARRKVFRMMDQLFADRERLKAIHIFLSKLETLYFSVIAEVLETLKKALDEQYDMVYKGTYGKKFHSYASEAFVPIDFQQESAGVIIDYLSGSISSTHLRYFSQDFLETIMDNKQAWARLDPKASPNGPLFDAPAQIRSFLNRKIDKFTYATIEDLLVKLYANDKDAKYDPSVDPSSEACLRKAAEVIFDAQFGCAANRLNTACVDWGIHMNHQDFLSRRILMVPETAPHLLSALQTLASLESTSVEVVASSSLNQICSYEIYSAVPAFKFDWTQTADRYYESCIQTEGLHMSETITGPQWRDYPSLLPMSTWPLRYGHTNPREAAVVQQARALFAKALTFSLADIRDSRYLILSLHSQYLPDKVLLREYDLRDVANADLWTVTFREKIREQIQKQAQEHAQKLFLMVEDWHTADNIVQKLEAADAGLFLRQDFIPFCNGVPDENLASSFLRKDPELMENIRGTIEVLEQLKRKILSSN